MVWREIVRKPNAGRGVELSGRGLFWDGLPLREMPGEQVIHLSVVRAFGELGEHFVEVVPRFYLTSTAGGHEAIDHRAGARATGRIAKQPVFPAGAKRTNIPLNEVIIDGGMAIFRIAAQVNPLLAGVANGFAKQAFG